MHQPTAAALVYANLNTSDDNTFKKVLVFNMGGTSIDISVIQIEDYLVTVKASDGDPYCGGEDFDNALVAYLLEEFKKSTGKNVVLEPRARIRLKFAAEKAKKQLSDAQEAQIEVDELIKGENLEMTITRTLFE
jgi:molecular chaperone DnaK